MGMAAELDALNKLKKANEDDLKLTAFRNAQGVGTQTMKDGFDQELKGVGMGDKARDRMRADLALQQKYAADVASLNEQLQAKALISRFTIKKRLSSRRRWPSGSLRKSCITRLSMSNKPTG